MFAVQYDMSAMHMQWRLASWHAQRVEGNVRCPPSTPCYMITAPVLRLPAATDQPVWSSMSVDMTACHLNHISTQLTGSGTPALCMGAWR